MGKKTKEEIIQESIIVPYKEFSGRDNIPKNKQYWTTDKDELDILLDEGFISKSQFHTYNQRGYGDEMRERINDGRRRFNPAVVYYNIDRVDSISYLASILMLVGNNAKDVMVVSNFVFGKSYNSSSHPITKMIVHGAHDVISQLANHIPIFEKIWEVFPFCYEYQKVNSERKMGRMILSKR